MKGKGLRSELSCPFDRSCLACLNKSLGRAVLVTLVSASAATSLFGIWIGCFFIKFLSDGKALSCLFCIQEISSTFQIIECNVKMILKLKEMLLMLFHNIP